MEMTIKFRLYNDDMKIEGSEATFNRLAAVFFTAYESERRGGLERIADNYLAIGNQIYDALKERGYYDGARKEVKSNE